QNYPNPFNPTTKIKFTIPASLNPSKVGTLVQLKVFDILGKEIALLINEEKQSGTYEIEFDGSSLSSGVYLYRLTAGNFNETKKFVLLK
ncbi:MAG: T9SS type A sorting domain-containing protein, partial [Ignavibacteriaceae bacterium]|nr:T9SS type A sorting domain-containing protein [Ignavibacteriaceae bacterium]